MFDIKEGDTLMVMGDKLKGIALLKANAIEDNIIINYAQITDDTDSEGNPVEDRDSTPNKWEESPRNDDQDIEKITVAYFDLALYKWVTSAIVIEDGKTTIYDSGHTQEDKTNVLNVSLKKDKLNKVSVKFKYKILVEKILKSGYNVIYTADTVCNATAERQKEAEKIASDVDMMLVIGSPGSSNTRKLFEICSKKCNRSYFIRNAGDLRDSWFTDVTSIGITAGASTPKKILREVQTYVRKF